MINFLRKMIFWFIDTKEKILAVIIYRPRFWKYYKKVSNRDCVYSYDVVDSSIESIFSVFVMFYERQKDKFYPVDEVMRIYHEDPNYKRHAGKTAVRQRKDAYTYMHQIYVYITASREENQKILEDIEHEIYKDAMSHFEKNENNCYTLVVDVEPKHLKLKWKYDKFGKVSITKKEECSGCASLLDLEQDLVDKDSEFAKRIIDIRKYLW